MNDIKIAPAFVTGEYLVERRGTGQVLGRVRKDRDGRWFALERRTSMLVSSEAADRKFPTRTAAVDAVIAHFDLTAVV